MKRILLFTLLAVVGLVPLKPALAQVAISVSFGPPALPIYTQPPCPEDGWIWVPGYWAWDADYDDYYWVPGTWVAAPETGYLWTPPWWGWENGAYSFHRGYWATQVGFYGGINYGFGYFGHGYGGGRWDHDHFYYNRAVTNVNTTVIHNVYVNKTVIVNNNVHVSYNGGQGGIQARPTQQEETVARMQHVEASGAQEQRVQMARSNPQMRATANHGRPAIAATARPTDFKGQGVVQARAAGAPYHPPANRQAQHGANPRPGNENARQGNEHSRPGNENARPGNENARPGNENSRPEENAPARPETHQPPARPTPEERPAPAERNQEQKRPQPRPETAPRPPERTQPQPERQHPAPENRPAPRSEPQHHPAERPAPKPESKPKEQHPPQ